MTHQDTRPAARCMPRRPHSGRGPGRSPGILLLLLLGPALLTACGMHPVHSCLRRSVPRAEAEAFDELQDRWVKTPDLPKKLGGARAVVIGGDIYVVGGGTNRRSATPSLYRFEPTPRRWERLDDMPSTRRRHAAVAAGTDVYVIGGTGGTRFVEVYDTTAGVWRVEPDMPNDHDWHDAVVVGSRIFVLGGETDMVDALDTTSGLWTGRAPLPGGALSGMAAATDGTSIFIIGGQGPGAPEGTQTDDVWIYDVATDSYSAGPAVPEPGHLFRSALVNGRLFVFAAFGMPQGRGELVGEDRRTVWVYDTGLQTWVEGEPQPNPHYEMAVTVDGDRFYLFGGWDHRTKGCG